MKLKDAIRYYELTGRDILSDIDKQAQYLRDLELFDFVHDDFTEVLESLYENLLLLWSDGKVIDENISIPTKEELTAKYLTSIPKEKSEEDNQEVVFEAPSLLKKTEKTENKTFNLLVSLVNSEIDISQFMNFEIELVIDIVNTVAEKREEQEKKNKNKL
ncbi:hypothetical protein GHI93_12020 [Lactococcus hircilactis]|uniref:Uncharacterized protein n=1 Tax=Lactococcus hircilactis TaxID=1494462 RepID=A0A7X2D1K1_9LACT|nr:hypothetical protein [Lactococcus hircilactis]MQW40641.1 hypothetical protein [Lactococcus hircilactis]